MLVPTRKSAHNGLRAQKYPQAVVGKKVPRRSLWAQKCPEALVGTLRAQKLLWALFSKLYKSV